MAIIIIKAFLINVLFYYEAQQKLMRVPQNEVNKFLVFKFIPLHQKFKVVVRVEGSVF